MKIFATCMECQKILGHPSPEAFILPYYDDRLANVTCSRGHKSVLIIQSPKFDVLLEAGANAFADGETLQAVTCFATALERFFEFCIEVFCSHRQMPSAIYDRMFKDMARQSERQIGAFLLLHADELGGVYEINPKIAEFRNGAIHKGTIPTPDEAERFCGMVYKEVISLHRILLSKYAGAYDKVIQRDLIERAKKIPKGIPNATSTGTIFLRGNKDTFQEAIDTFIHGRNMINLAPAVLPIFANFMAHRMSKPTSVGEPSPVSNPNEPNPSEG